MRHTHHTEQVLYKGVPLLATTPATDNEVERSNVKLAAHISVFIFRKKDLVAANISVVRGDDIVWDGRTYEVINEAGKTYYSNDPFELDLCVMTVKR